MSVLLKALTIVPQQSDPHFSKQRIRTSYEVKHNNGTTTVSQQLTLRLDEENNGWVADMTIEDVPAQKTPQEAVEKLSDWLIRLGTELKNADVNAIDLVEITKNHGYYTGR